MAEGPLISIERAETLVRTVGLQSNSFVRQEESPMPVQSASFSHFSPGSLEIS